jgi:hypothetical protein
MAKPKTNPAPMANMADLAIQPNTVPYTKEITDMGNGITRITFVAVKDDE